MAERRGIHGREQTIFRALLRQARQEAGLRQADLAMRLGVPQSYVSKYETGERRLDALELRRVCLALGTSLTAFAQRLEERLAGDGS